jgi:trk system potassium uptake protein
MNFKGIGLVVSDYLFMFAGFTFFFGVAICLYFQFYVPASFHPAPHPTEAFILTMLITLFCAVMLKVVCEGGEKFIQLREAIVLVVSIWLITSVVGALPFTISGTLEHFIDAWFEAVSGLTTTGSTILHPKAYDATGQEVAIVSNYVAFQPIQYIFYGTVKPVIDSATHKVLFSGVEALPQGLLFWRSFLHWYGGMGIVLLFVALLPALGTSGRVLFRYESTGPLFAPLFPQVRQTAIVLLAIYIILTLANIFFLLITNSRISVFDAVNVAFSTISTGGFAPKNASIGAYESSATDIVTMIFMTAGGINFAIYYDLIKGRFYKLFDTELLAFLGIIAVASTIAAWGIHGSNKILLTGPLEHPETYSWADSFRYGAFHVISCITNTGFSSCDFDKWPAISQTIILLVMYLGGMAGSTSGGLKIVRVCILWKCAKNAIVSLFRRSEVRITRIGNREIDSETTIGVLTFFLIMVLTSLVGILALLIIGVDIETSIGLNGCMINNTGNAFRAAGPTESCAFLSPIGKFICIVWMLVGRLEYYAWFALFLPSFWKNR